MKKTLLLAGAAVLLSSNVQAMEWKPYVGLDYVYSMVDLAEGDSYFEDKLNAFAVSAGTRFHKNFGMEAFYQRSEEGEKKFFETVKAKDKYQAYGVDFIGYMPLGCEQKFELLGSLGLGYYDVDASVKEGGYKLSSYSDTGIGYRIGAGMQYNLTENMSARVMARYVDTDIDALDNIVDVTAGIRYSF